MRVVWVDAEKPRPVAFFRDEAERHLVGPLGLPQSLVGARSNDISLSGMGATAIPEVVMRQDCVRVDALFVAQPGEVFVEVVGGFAGIGQVRPVHDAVPVVVACFSTLGTERWSLPMRAQS